MAGEATVGGAGTQSNQQSQGITADNWLMQLLNQGSKTTTSGGGGDVAALRALLPQIAASPQQMQALINQIFTQGAQANVPGLNSAVQQMGGRVSSSSTNQLMLNDLNARLTGQAAEKLNQSQQTAGQVAAQIAQNTKAPQVVQTQQGSLTPLESAALGLGTKWLEGKVLPMIKGAGSSAVNTPTIAPTIVTPAKTAMGASNGGMTSMIDQMFPLNLSTGFESIPGMLATPAQQGINLNMGNSANQATSPAVADSSWLNDIFGGSTNLLGNSPSFSANKRTGTEILNLITGEPSYSGGNAPYASTGGINSNASVYNYGDSNINTNYGADNAYGASSFLGGAASPNQGGSTNVLNKGASQWLMNANPIIGMADAATGGEGTKTMSSLLSTAVPSITGQGGMISNLGSAIEGAFTSIGNTLSKGCYITTAVCELEGKPDNCAELEALRNYRDEVLAREPLGQQLIQQYYHEAPRFLQAIHLHPQRDAMLRRFSKEYIKPAVESIKAKNYDETFRIYTAMLKDANGYLVADAAAA